MNTNDRNDDAAFAVLDMALDEELGRAAPPDLWSRLSPTREQPSRARRLAVAALVLLAASVVTAISVMSRAPEPQEAVRPGRTWVDPDGPTSLLELQTRLAAAKRATVTAEATWSPELDEFVPLVRQSPLERLFQPGLRPEIDVDQIASIEAALRQATLGALLGDVAWTHVIDVRLAAEPHGVLLLLQVRTGVEPLLAFAGPNGPVALHAPRATASVDEELASVTADTIAKLGVVIGTNGFAAVARDDTGLRLVRVPADGVRELVAFPRLQNLDLVECPAWHDTSVLQAIAHVPLHDLWLRPDRLDSGAWSVLGSMRSLRELALLPPDWLEIARRGAWQVTPAPGLDDAAILALRELNQLTELNLCGGSFGDASLRTLGALPELRQLALIGCTHLGGDSLAAMVNVSGLALVSCSALREDFVAAAATLPKLKDLTIVQTGCRVDVRALRPAQKLTHLHVAARVPPDELRFLAELPALQTLTLQLDPPLRDEDLVWLHGLGQLRQLVIASDAVTERGLASLRAALPRCTVTNEVL